MENYIGLIISIEKYHESDRLRKVQFAKNDAEKFIESLVNAGCDESKLHHLYDNFATKTSIIEKTKELAKYAQPSDTLIFFYAGHGFNLNGENLLSAVDTSFDNLKNTTVELKTILSAFDDSNSNKAIAFLDCCHSGIDFSETERAVVSDFSSDNLKYEYSNAEYLTVFASCKKDERSQADIERKHGVWSYYLINALNGNAPGIYDNDLLFSDKLQKYLGDNTFQRVKMITPEKKNQTPVKYGKETTDKFIVADLAKTFTDKRTKASANGITFSKAIILTSSEDWIKNLPGFKSNHSPPKDVSDYHNNWVKSISEELLNSELNEIAEKLRKKLNYKRKDISKPVIYDGAGQLSTKDFDYHIDINQSQEDSKNYVITKRIENFKNSDNDILKNKAFNEVFSNTFDELKFELSEKIDIDNIIDIIEDAENEELINVSYNQSDISRCEIQINDFSGTIYLSEYSFKISTYGRKSPQKLILSCQNVYTMLNEQGMPKLLE